MRADPRARWSRAAGLELWDCPAGEELYCWACSYSQWSPARTADLLSAQQPGSGGPEGSSLFVLTLTSQHCWTGHELSLPTAQELLNKSSMNRGSNKEQKRPFLQKPFKKRRGNSVLPNTSEVKPAERSVTSVVHNMFT
ncbi:hypothetical protein AOLI_G00261440 [Acnodon oligacanthus]